MKNNNRRTYSIWQLVLSVIAVLLLWMAALLMLGLGSLEVFSSGGSLNQGLSMFMTAAVSIFCSFLVLFSAFFSLYTILGKQPEDLYVPAWIGKPLGWLLAFLIVIWLGNLVSATEFAWLFLPGLHILGIGLPVLWMLYLASRDLPLGSLQRRWGVFASGLVLGPGLIMIAEGIALVFLLVVVGVWLSGQPALIEQLGAFSDWTVNPDLNPEELIDALAPILLTPGALVLALFFAAVLVPLIEELFKPIGVWLLFGRKLTPEAGFSAGAISGAGYALFESLALTLGGDGWAVVVLARIGTAGVHILTSAITGWALVQAWQKRGFLRLLAAYTFGVILHGLWNGLAILSVFASLSNLVEEPAQWLLNLQPAVYGTFLVGFLALASLAGLIGFNRKLALDRNKRTAVNP